MENKQMTNSTAFSSYYESMMSSNANANIRATPDPCRANETTAAIASTVSATTRSSNARALGDPKIAIISGFVTRQKGPKAPQVKSSNYDHMINKACYANLWGYDFIFNTSWGFDQDVKSKYWLEYGTWHRVPHMAAALPNYDWIVYADVDWYVRDMTIPLESFIRDWDLHGFHNVSIFIPVDVNGIHVFSAYVVMIRNNAFGRRMIENWLRFAQGLCPKGNFPTTPGKYEWGDSDQPGIWYSLAKTHSEFTGNTFDVKCKEDGTIDTGRFMGPEMRQYFIGLKVPHGGNQGKDLYNIPKGEWHKFVVQLSSLIFHLTLLPHHTTTLRRKSLDQIILWSKIDNETKGGLGIQQTYGKYHGVSMPRAFAYHRKEQLTGQFKADVETCKRERGCYAYYDDSGIFQIGCNHTART